MQERKIRSFAGSQEVTALLDSSPTADLVWEALPIRVSASTWGEGIYFRTEIVAHEKDAREVVEMGDVGY